MKESQVSQVKEFSAFLCTGRCKTLGSLKSLLGSAPYLSRAGLLCFPILGSLRGHRWGPQRPGGLLVSILSPLHPLSGVTVAVAAEDLMASAAFVYDKAGSIFHSQKKKKRCYMRWDSVHSVKGLP